jgi:lysozyme
MSLGAILLQAILGTKPLADTERQARAVIEFEEGSSLSAYPDTKGFWTIGVGHKIGKGISELRLSAAVVEVLFREDLAAATASVRHVLGEEDFNRLAPARRVALISMAFQMGEKNLSEFHSTLGCVRTGDWLGAAAHAGQSLWARQTPARAARTIAMLRTGEYPKEYGIG